MTNAERALWDRVQRRASALSPELAAELMRAWREIAAHLTTAQIEALVQGGAIDRILGDAVLDRDFAGVRRELHRTVAEAVPYFARDIPQSAGVIFNVLNPRVIAAIRELDTTVMQKLKTDVREAVRAHIEEGLREGIGPRTMARGIRSAVGLAPNQVEAVANFRRALEARDFAKARAYKLRDRRFALKRGMTLTPEKIDRMVEAYRKRFVAFHAETHARTASLQALKLGQRLSWEDAVAKDIVPGDRLFKTWVGVLDARERPTHVAMEGDTVRYNSPYHNGQMDPGDDEYNCRCISRFQVFPASFAA